MNSRNKALCSEQTLYTATFGKWQSSNGMGLYDGDIDNLIRLMPHRTKMNLYYLARTSRKMRRDKIKEVDLRGSKLDNFYKKSVKSQIVRSERRRSKIFTSKFYTIIYLAHTVGWGVFFSIFLSYQPQCGKVAKGCKNDPLEILARSVKVLRFSMDL